MDISIINLLLIGIIWILVPLMAGSGFCGMFSLGKSWSKCFLVGHVLMWAVCQVIAVPCILLKAHFYVVVVLVTLILVALSAYSVYKGHIKRLFVNSIGEELKQSGALDLAGIMLVWILLGFMIYQSIVLFYGDADDSRFVVNAVDVYRTNRLILTDVNTGKALTTWIGDMYKDVVAPWAVYMAYISKLVGLYPTVVMHTVFPPVILVVLTSVYWLLAKELVGEKRRDDAIFVLILLLLHIYGNYSRYSAEGRFLVRSWQGKSVLASVGIPAMMLAFLWFYKSLKEYGIQESPMERKESGQVVLGGWLLLLGLDLAGALFSSMSMILCPILIGCFGLIYGAARKSIRLTIMIWLCMIPNVICYIIAMGIRP